jgi:hypothetical protein
MIACFRLHNFCNKRRLPTLYSPGKNPPAHCDVDSDGRLIDPQWRVPVAAGDAWTIDFYSQDPAINVIRGEIYDTVKSDPVKYKVVRNKN